MKKILLINHHDTGGAERMTLLYGKILEKAANYNIDLLLLSPRTNRPFTFNIKPFIPANWHYKSIKSRYLYHIFHIFRYLLLSRPDIVFTSLPGIFPLLILKRFHLISSKVIIRESNMPSTFTANHNKQAQELYRYADAIIAQTEEMKSEMISYYNLKDTDITVINNPIDKDLIALKLNETENIPQGYVNYMACSRIVPQKDILTMVRAFAIVKKQISNARLYLIGKEGTKEYMDEIKTLIEEKQLNDDIIFTGFQDNPYKYTKKADVFVLSSTYEGLPNAMIEAMYLGIPVAATRCIPYISQVIKEGTNGYTSPMQNPEALAQAMIKAKDIKNLEQNKNVNSSENLIVKTFNRLS